MSLVPARLACAAFFRRVLARLSWLLLKFFDKGFDEPPLSPEFFLWALPLLVISARGLPSLVVLDDPDEPLDGRSTALPPLDLAFFILALHHKVKVSSLPWLQLCMNKKVKMDEITSKATRE